MLLFLIYNMYVVYRYYLIREFVRGPMDTNCSPLRYDSLYILNRQPIYDYFSYKLHPKNAVPRVNVCADLNFVFFIEFMKLVTVGYFLLLAKNIGIYILLSPLL